MLPRLNSHPRLLLPTVKTQHYQDPSEDTLTLLHPSISIPKCAKQFQVQKILSFKSGTSNLNNVLIDSKVIKDSFIVFNTVQMETPSHLADKIDKSDSGLIQSKLNAKS